MTRYPKHGIMIGVTYPKPRYRGLAASELRSFKFYLLLLTWEGKVREVEKVGSGLDTKLSLPPSPQKRGRIVCLDMAYAYSLLHSQWSKKATAEERKRTRKDQEKFQYLFLARLQGGAWRRGLDFGRNPAWDCPFKVKLMEGAKSRGKKRRTFDEQNDKEVLLPTVDYNHHPRQRFLE